ncbi:hypothetical protein JRO89_XS13G0056900 [Xanthoceras sorbifolium]|uniref:Uncharacterized protein n=1 Tax=Xanthoceras sorbifolium TaxID=99658 RepID=A0ABQ8H6S6_9ROSI|nr:hypothetical protein JRO89_XS13G0056900 [Xanthoceras sorbifolium]
MANHSDDLDQLLDSALDDFQNFNLTPLSQRSGEGNETQKKQESGSLPSGVQGLGMGLPDLKSKKKGKQKVAKDSHVTEALDKLREQTREAVKGLESMEKPGGNDLGKDAMVEDWVKQFEELAGSQIGLKRRSLSMGSLDFLWKLCPTCLHPGHVKLLELSLERGTAMIFQMRVLFYDHLAENRACTENKIDMESIVETMMQQLLSKDILHDPMKEIGERYPKWLEDHEASLSKEEYERYSHQYELIKQLNEVYENDSGNFTKIVDLMQKMQECGQPPNDIVQELAPDFDLASVGQLSPEMLESQQNCSIM